MGDDRDASLSSAFDALLDKNRQRLDDLSSTSSRERAKTARPMLAPAQPSASVPTPAGGKRRTGRSDGREFSFDT